MTQRISRVLSLLPFLLAACGGDSDLVRVDVRTDWVPTVEFAEVEIGLDAILRVEAIAGGRINDMELINREMFIYKRDVASLLPVGPTIAQTWTASVQVCSSGDGQYVGKSVFFANS